jgi:hypothetical protein
MTPAARLAALDASLAANRAPADLEAELVAAGVGSGRLFETPAGHTVIDDYKAEVAGNHSRFSGHRLANALSKGALFGAGGVIVGTLVAALPGAPFILGGAALVYGAVSDWRATTQRNVGTVAVDVDGVKGTARYVGSPNVFPRSPAELRAELYAAGVLGDRIEPLRVNDDELPQLRIATLKRLGREKIGELSRLVKARRLVADFGNRSRYDKPVLQVVSLVTAMRLCEGNRPMLVVTGEDTNLTTHGYDTSAQRADGAVQSARSQGYVERTFRYSLTPYADGNHGDGTGVPPGMQGVATIGGSFTDVIGADELKTYTERSNDPDHRGGRVRRHIDSRASGRRLVTA